MDFVKQLKEQINIAEVVGEYVRLRKTGSNYMGLCPFHAERSPSFSVTEKRQIYHCFGCQKSGDVISFVQEMQAVSFHEAIRILAQKFNIKLPAEFQSRGGSGTTESGAAQDRNEVYFKLNRFVAQYYHECLLAPGGKAAREYLARRGVSELTIKNAYLGYAPAGWSELYEFLESKQAPLDAAEELGLIRRKEKADNSGRAHYDLFRDRLMFPVTDLRGRVIAFGGRALGEDAGPKYLNSSESPVFKKGSHLFGIFYAQKEIRAEDRCVVVEGFMDCLALQQAGIGYTVATLGTALGEKQVALLKRFTRNIVLLFDGDSAGKEAQARAMEVFLNEDVVVRGVTLPEELDPDEFVMERGGAALTALLTAAPYLLDQRVLELASEAGGHAEARARAVDKALPWIARIASDTSRLVRLQEISGLFDVKVDALERRVAELRKELKPHQPARGSGPALPRGMPQPIRINQGPKAPAPIDMLDARVIETLIVHPRFAPALAALGDDALEGLETESSRKMVTALLAAVGAAGGSVGAEALEWAGENDGLRALVGGTLVLAEREQDAATDAERLALIEQAAKDLYARIVRRGLERRKEKLRAVVLKAAGLGEPGEYSRLMSEYNDLAKRLDRNDESKPKEVM